MKFNDNSRMSFIKKNWVDYHDFGEYTKFDEKLVRNSLNEYEKRVDIEYEIGDDNVKYFHLRKMYSLDVCGVSRGGGLPLFISYYERKVNQPTLFGIYYYNEIGERISSNVLTPNKNYFLDVPKNAVKVSFSIRLHGKGDGCFYCILFSFYDYTSTHIFKLSEQYQCRMKIDNISSVKNGIIVFMPGAYTLRKFGILNFPVYPRISWAKDLLNYCVVFIADPVCDLSLNVSNSSYFLDKSGDSWLLQIAEYLKGYFESGSKFYVYGSSMGGYSAILLSFFLNADYCIAECPISNLENSPYSKNRVSRLEDKKFYYLHISQFFNKFYKNSHTKMLIHYYSNDSELKNFMNEYSLINKNVLETMQIKIEIENINENGKVKGHDPIPKDEAINKINFCFSRENLLKREMQQKHIIFDIRFSFLLSNVDSCNLVNSSNYDFEENKSKLFDEARLEECFFIFENITLKSLNNIYTQRGDKDNIVVFIFMSELLPQKYKDRFVSIQESYEFIKIKYYKESEELYHVLTEYLTHNVHVGDMYASVRMEGNDALSLAWYKTLLTYLKPIYTNHVVSLHSGYTLYLEKNGRVHIKKMDLSRFNATGLSVIGQKVSEIYEPQSVYGLGAHTIVDRNSPCIVDGSKPFVLRTISGYNDTYSVHPRKKINPKDNEFLNVTEKQNVLNLFGIYLNLANKNL